MRILVVEDELRMAELLQTALDEDGHQVVVAQDGRMGFEIAQSAAFDAIILDWMLPGMDGPTVARKLRRERNQIPILMLTAHDSVADTVAGLDSGVDDYLTKPFAIDVLLARLRAVSRRGPVTRTVCLEIGDLRLDLTSRSVTRAGENILLTPREYRLLELLMRNSGRAMSRNAILQSVWGFETEVSENSIEVFMRTLRGKVDTDEPKLIHTVRGFGYLMKKPGTP